MKNKILLWINKIRMFISLAFKDKVLILKVLILTAIARFAMLKVPFKKLKKHMGKVNTESEFKINDTDINLIEVIKDLKRFRWAIQVVAKRTPWDSKCLVQALTAQYLINNRGLSSTLYLGVKKESANNLIAHAWLRCGEFYITGGNGEGYGITAKFTKEGKQLRG